MNINAYLRLMRFDKPVGIILLWSPTAWALWLANRHTPDFKLLFYFLVGTILMRAAGCIINDITDRKIDRHVKRTQKRPLAAKEIKLKEAIFLLILLLTIAFIIVLQLPITCLYYALFAVAISTLYPFCKRFLSAPQFILGIAFSMGIPMAYAASGVNNDFTMWILFLLNFVWIVAYDTEYAMVDKDDDLKIGVKSTAILFKDSSQLIILLLQLVFHSLWLIIASNLNYPFLFLTSWLVGGLILIYQQRLLACKTRDDYFRAFTSNAWYGICMWLGLGALVLN